MAVTFTAANSRIADTTATAPSRGSGTVMIRIAPAFSSADSTARCFWFHKDAATAAELSYQRFSDNKIYVGWTTASTNYRLVVADTGVYTSGEGWSTHIFTYNAAAGVCFLYKNKARIGSREASIVTTAMSRLTLGNYDVAVFDGSAGSAIQDFARWDVVLPWAAICDLADGANPEFVDRGNLRSYVPIMSASGETDRINGDLFVQSGTAMSIADGPPQWFGARSDLTHYTGTSPPPPPPSNTNYLMPMLGVGDD